MTEQNIIDLRLARLSDVPFLESVEQSASMAFHALPDYQPSGRTVPREILTAMIKEKLLWVAVTDIDKPVGFAGCRNIDDILYLHEISVAHAFQKKGIGRRLMLLILEHAKNAGYSALGLTTRRDAIWNMPFYQSLGFHEMMSIDEQPALYQQLQNEILEGANPLIRCAMLKKLDKK